jgi:tRNA 2-thiouridine synthesizing protein D
MPEPSGTLTFVLNDPPYESARSTTALRLIDAALRKGYDVNVFAYEGAAALAFARQAPHANAVHGNDVAAEDHPNTKDWVSALVDQAAGLGRRLDWVNCGLCVDERGVGESVAGTRRGSPADLWTFVGASTNTLVIPTK